MSCPAAHLCRLAVSLSGDSCRKDLGRPAATYALARIEGPPSLCHSTINFAVMHNAAFLRPCVVCDPRTEGST
jgi:hypothetical protein